MVASSVNNPVASSTSSSTNNPTTTAKLAISEPGATAGPTSSSSVAPISPIEVRVFARSVVEPVANSTSSAPEGDGTGRENTSELGEGDENVEDEDEDDGENGESLQEDLGYATMLEKGKGHRKRRSRTAAKKRRGAGTSVSRESSKKTRSQNSRNGSSRFVGSVPTATTDPATAAPQGIGVNATAFVRGQKLEVMLAQPRSEGEEQNSTSLLANNQNEMLERSGAQGDDLAEDEEQQLDLGGDQDQQLDDTEATTSVMENGGDEKEVSPKSLPEDQPGGEISWMENPKGSKGGKRVHPQRARSVGGKKASKQKDNSLQESKRQKRRRRNSNKSIALELDSPQLDTSATKMPVENDEGEYEVSQSGQNGSMEGLWIEKSKTQIRRHRQRSDRPKTKQGKGRKSKKKEQDESVLVIFYCRLRYCVFRLPFWLLRLNLCVRHFFM